MPITSEALATHSRQSTNGMRPVIQVKTFPPTEHYKGERYKAITSVLARKVTKQIQAREGENYRDSQNRAALALMRKLKYTGVWYVGHMHDGSVAYVLTDFDAEHSGVNEIRD